VTLDSPGDSGFVAVEEPQVCSECQSVSRLTNGLCLNCLLRGALSEGNSPAGRDAFKEALAAVKSRDGDWHIADHEILHEIARGGMGVVYQGREPHSGRIVALKCVLAYQGDSDHVVARFRREAETAARLDHPNIVPIYQIGETADGFPYYTMKYAAAGSLLQARKPLLQHPRQSVELMLKVARAVQYAHHNKVLHRDLKPGNILLDNHGEPLVSDFGLARCEAVSSYLTRSLSSFGTPGYIAPEQADGPASNLAATADLYSLGAILFELLTGRTPFVGDNAFAVMKQSADEPAPKVRAFAPHVDRDLEKICARCLERDPVDRYQTAGAFADDLENWLAGNPISGQRLRPWRQLRRWAARHRKLAATLALILGIAAASVVWSIRTQRLESEKQHNLLAARSSIVLPFLDLDRVAPDDTVSRSVADSLKRHVASIGPAQIDAADAGSPLSWSAAFNPRVAGRATKARTLITGTIREVPNGKRISLRIVSAANGDPLLVKTWEVAAKDDFKVSDALARSLYTILSANDWSNVVQATDPAFKNPIARESITSGRDIMNHISSASDCDSIIRLLRKAIAREPNSTLAHAYLSMTAAGRTHYNGDRTYLVLANEEADKALALSPDSTDAHRAKSGVLYQEGRFRSALDEALRAVELGGFDERIVASIAQTFTNLGRPDKALGWLQIPFSATQMAGEIYAGIGDCWVLLGDDERALAAYHRAIELRPQAALGAVGLSHLELMRGNFEAARQTLSTAPQTRLDLTEVDQLAAQIEFFARDNATAEPLYRALFKRDPDGGGSFWGGVTHRSALARIAQELGRETEANELLAEGVRIQNVHLQQEPENPDTYYRLAALEASLGKVDSALEHLHRAHELGWIDYRSLQLDPRFDALRARPEFERLIADTSNNLGGLRADAQKNHDLESGNQ
jgi:serine/threonine protein kinase/tetratricopeptide (TPR) repeat protein